ncbi:unnamed protein product, partial [Meganyctiphanes norvegica]
QLVYGREFLRIRVSDDNAGSGRETISNRQSRMRQDNSRIDPEIDDISRLHITSQKPPVTSTHEEQRKSSVYRNSSYSRSLRLPWYRDSPLPVSSHTSREAVRRRLYVNNHETIDTKQIYPAQNSSSGSDLLTQNLENYPESSSGSFLSQNINYYPTKPSLNSTLIKHVPTRISQQNIQLNISIAKKLGSISLQKNNEDISLSAENSSHNPLPARPSPQSKTPDLFSEDIPNPKLHIDSTTLRTLMQNNHNSETTISKPYRDTITSNPLTTEIVSQTQPTSSTEFFLYQLSEYDDYYYSLGDETQLVSTIDEIAVTDPYIGKEPAADVITEAHFSNVKNSNESEYQISSNENDKIPVYFTPTTTDNNVQLYNNTIIIIPKNSYRNTLPTSTATPSTSTTSTSTTSIFTTSTSTTSPSTTSVVNLVQTKGPARIYKYTTPSLALRQRLLANRFKIGRFQSQRRSRLYKSNSQNLTNSELVIKKLEKNISNSKQNISISEKIISHNNTKNDADAININITNTLNIHSDTNNPPEKSQVISKLFESSTTKSQIDYSKDQQQGSLPTLQLQNPSEVNTPLVTSIPLPSPLHLLADPLVVELNRGPIMTNQGYNRSAHDTIGNFGQLTMAIKERNDSNESSQLDTNDTFSIVIPSTAIPITDLPRLDLSNFTEFT